MCRTSDGFSLLALHERYPIGMRIRPRRLGAADSALAETGFSETEDGLVRDYGCDPLPYWVVRNDRAVARHDLNCRSARNELGSLRVLPY